MHDPTGIWHKNVHTCILMKYIVLEAFIPHKSYQWCDAANVIACVALSLWKLPLNAIWIHQSAKDAKSSFKHLADS